MEELRSEIRSAFEKEQALCPPAPSLRRDVVNAVAAHPRQAPNLQWVAVAAAILLGFAVVAGLMSSRLAGQRTPAPATSPKASPVADYGPPPASVPLVYVQDPNHSSWLIGFDWTGKPRGTVKLAQPIDPFRVLIQAPDGSAFRYVAAKGGDDQFLDRLGSPLTGQSTSLFYQSQMWADDSRHLCALAVSSRGWTLGLRLPGAAPAFTRIVALDPKIVQSGIIAISFAACSVRNDRAIITYSYAGRASQLWLVRISDGTILSHRSYPADQLGNITASSDGAWIAENSAKSDGQLVAAAPSTIIRRISDMAAIATLDPTTGVIGFNSDDSLALVTTSPWASGIPTSLALINVQTGAVLWRSDGTTEFAGFLPQPNGKDLAVMLTDPVDSSLHPPVDLVIVHSDGVEIQSSATSDRFSTRPPPGGK
jgi:hypothetical protein